MTLTSGALFAGYGGLSLAVEDALGAHPLWFSEYEPPSNRAKAPTQSAARIFAHHWPGIPNLGDITAVDWSHVPRVDVLEGGSPCQDVSGAGKREGMHAATRSGLWASMCDACEILRPRLVVWENVHGALSARADSGVECCAVCLAERGEDPGLRALGRVVGDLSEIGYDAAWCTVRASDVGAPHHRPRVFVLAWPASDSESIRRPGGIESAIPTGAHGRSRHAAQTVWDRARSEGVADTNRFGFIGEQPRLGTRCHAEGCGEGAACRWEEYCGAIHRWERLLDRAAPEPTQISPRGSIRETPEFVEWMMGLPSGWVTDVPRITHLEQRKALGNGVVPQQGAAALRHLLQFVPAAVLASLRPERVA